jgi:hypothetical protein
MRNKISARRRAATLLAALAVLTMSSGVALMVSASPASAAKTPVNICHATSSDTNPYVFITVDNDSAKLKGHLMHHDDPNKHWKSAGTYEGQPHAAGDLKPDLIGSYTDVNGVFQQMDGNITSASCDDVVVETPPAVADVDFTDPTCANDNTADWDGTGSHVTFTLTDGTVGPGNTIEVTATADEGYTFEDESTTMKFTHEFSAAESPCGEVSTPAVTGDVTFTDPTCDTDPSVTLPEAAPVEVPSRTAAGPVITTKDVDGVHYAVTGDLAAGGTVDVDATALDGFVIAEGATTHWEHTFTTPAGCTRVSPPETVPESTTKTETPVATPMVVHAGLESATKTDLRSQQGLVLLVGGAILMLAAGGLGLNRPRRTSRI